MSLPTAASHPPRRFDPSEIAPFKIAKAPVANAEFAAFVDDGG
jgi:formylglycine-generating enzyme required for sulfatase activity